MPELEFGFEDPGSEAAIKLAGQSDNTSNKAGDPNNTTNLDAATSAALAAEVRRIVARGAGDTDADALAVEDQEPVRTKERGRLATFVRTTAGKVAVLAAITTATTGGALAACSTAKKSTITQPGASGAPGIGGGVTQAASPEASVSSRIDLHSLTEKEAANLTLDQIKTIVLSRNLATFTMDPGYAANVADYTPETIFDMYHGGLYGQPMVKDIYTEAITKGECPTLHLFAHGMDQIWYIGQCAMISQQGKTVNQDLGVDDGDIALKDPANKVFALKDGSLLAVVKTGNQSKVLHKETAYILVMKCGEPKDQPGYTVYYTIRIGFELYNKLNGQRA